MTMKSAITQTRQRPKILQRILFAIALVVSCAVLLLLHWIQFDVTIPLRNPQIDSTKGTVQMPNGRRVPLYNHNLVPRKLSEVLRICEYKNGTLICPNVKLQGETVARQLQLAVGRMLRILHLMSVKHTFNYWLFGGILVGAKRHQRFIPWDEDGDVCMMRKDYEIFRKHASSELPGDVFFQTAQTDGEWAKVKRWHEARLRDDTSCYGYCLKNGCKNHDGYQIDIIVMDPENDNTTLYDRLNKLRLNKKDVFPLKTVEFEGFTFKAPHAIDLILKLRYGEEFARPPPLKQRCSEYIGLPWFTCDELAAMSRKQREDLLHKTKMTCPG